MTLKEMSKTMAEIDLAMLATRTDGGQLATPPMSNNGEVEYDGDSFYFSWDSARTSAISVAIAHVALSFQGSAGLLVFPGKRGAARWVSRSGGEQLSAAPARCDRNTRPSQSRLTKACCSVMYHV